MTSAGSSSPGHTIGWHATQHGLRRCRRGLSPLAHSGLVGVHTREVHRGHEGPPSPALQSYRESRPIAGLQEVVSVLWVQHLQSFARPNLHRSIPNGAVELRCRLGSTPELVGPLSRPRAELLAPGTTVIGLRLRPAVAGSVFGAPASEFVDITVGVDDVWGEKARAIGERLAELTVPGELVTLLQELLLGRVPDEDGSDRLVSEAVKRMMQPHALTGLARLGLP